MTQPTKQRLIEAGLSLLLERGYNNLGLQALLDGLGIPKGSFYHHFRDKEDFALQVIDAYVAEVHRALEACLGDEASPPLARIRCFFTVTERKYREDGYLGCLMGGLGQELSGTSETFRRKIEHCLSLLGQQLGGCLAEAQRRGEIMPGVDPEQLGNLLVNCWEGAALRSRIRRDPGALGQMLDFYLGSVTVQAPRARRTS